jgi:hypothetical protein
LNLSNFYFETSEFAPPGKYGELGCKGRHCDNCGKCRDWYYTGDLTTWRWIQNCSNWQQNDWQRFNNDKIWERFQKRDGASCNNVNHVVYLNLLGGLSVVSGNLYCVCDENRVT